MPTFQVCLTAPVVGVDRHHGVLPVDGTYRVDPSGEKAGSGPAQGRVAVSTFGQRHRGRRAQRAVGVDGEPGQAVLLCDSQRNLPSGEYVGPSWPTVPSVSFWLTADALPTVQISL